MSRGISTYDFFGRFTDAELAAFVGSLDVHVVAFRFKLPYRPTTIDLDAADIVAGVNYLVTMTPTPVLASQARATAILA